MGNSVGSLIRIYGSQETRYKIEEMFSALVLDVEEGVVDHHGLYEALPSKVWRKTTLLWIETEETEQCLHLRFRTDWDAPIDAIRLLSHLHQDIVIIGTSDDTMACWRVMWMARQGKDEPIYLDNEWDAFGPYGEVEVGK